MKKVMIVDDEKELRDMINLMMVKEGYITETANDGQEFINKIDIFKPDVVTLDVMMPGLNTLQILDKLSNKKTQPKIILITVVRLSEYEKKLLLKRDNVIGYLAKPFEF